TVMKGIKEVREGASDGEAPERSRRAGGGRKPAEVKDPYLVKALDALVEPTSRGDPQSPLRWTCKSTRALARELTSQGHAVSQQKVGELRSEEHTFELQSPCNLVCRLLLEKKKDKG